MSLTTHVLQSIRYYRRLNLSVVLGIALSTALLVGALVVGDSVKFGLQQVVRQRLGHTSQVITAGERLFSSRLSVAIAKETGVETTALLRSNGFGILDGGAARINQLAIWGVDPKLGSFGNDPEAFVLKENETAINEELAVRAGLKIGDEFLIRVNKLNTFPANTPFVAQDENSIAFRVKIQKILSSASLGNLNLRNIQSFPRNVFLNIHWLNKQMALQDKANVLLLAEGYHGKDLSSVIQHCWQTEDLNIKIRENSQLNYTELISDRVFVDPALEQFCSKKVNGSKPIFSYFVNSLKVNGLLTPYSFVSSDPELTGQQMMVNEWLAEDLKLKTGDTLHISFFQIGLQRELVEKDTLFVVHEIFPMGGSRSDKNLMPLIPGLSDAGNCRDWKTGVPVDLKKIRPKDEAYWKEFSGIPKAFVSLETARNLWGNRFGQATAIRIPGLKKAEFETKLLSGLSPTDVGFEVREVKEEGMTAASSGVDFGQLFIGLSFFVLFASVLLSFLLFRLFLNYRKSEIGTLYALGFSAAKIRRLFLTEASMYTLLGIVAGIPLALLYDYLILNAINTIWADMVRTPIADIYVNPTSVLTGCLAIAVISLATVWLVLNKFLKEQVVTLQRKSLSGKSRSGYRSAAIGTLLIVVSLLLLFLKGFQKGEVNPELFFISGLGILPGMILMADYWLSRLALQDKAKQFSVKSFRLRRLAGERSRQIQIISFLAVGFYLVASTGLNRKDLTKDAGLASSGTGGYRYFIETTIPVLTNPDTKKGREEFGLSENTRLVPFQVQPGDDASCLNLNRIARPRIIACNPESFDQRSAFSFASATADLDEKNPWLSLDRMLDENTIPAIADQTVILWGLGKKVGDTLVYKNEQGRSIHLKLIGGLQNSVLQGNIIISSAFFAQEFPSVSGSNLFLLDLPEKADSKMELISNWQAYGPDITLTTERLQTFNQIENTYLNIFLMLGAIGLLIGTVGFGILIFRITEEQRPEFSLLLALGFPKSFLYGVVLREKMVIMMVSVASGMIPALVSAWPALVSSSDSNLWIWLPVLSLVVVLSGTLCTLVAVKRALLPNLVPSLRND